MHQHAQLTVRMEPGKNTGGVIVVVEFPAKLHIKFVTELRYAFLNMFRLYSEILVIVKT